MKANIYSTTKEVVDKQGLKHVITVVGALTRERKKIDHISDAYIELVKISITFLNLNHLHFCKFARLLLNIRFMPYYFNFFSCCSHTNSLQI